MQIIQGLIILYILRTSQKPVSQYQIFWVVTPMKFQHIMAPERHHSRSIILANGLMTNHLIQAIPHNTLYVLSFVINIFVRPCCLLTFHGTIPYICEKHGNKDFILLHWCTEYIRPNHMGTYLFTIPQSIKSASARWYPCLTPLSEWNEYIDKVHIDCSA